MNQSPNKKHPDIKCKCGDMIPDMNYCEKCNQGNFGKRKLVIVGGILKSPNKTQDNNKFVCSCGSVYYKSDNYVKFNHWTRCACGEKAFWDDRPPRMVMTKFIKGYTGGYNEALGVDIKSKEHYN
jgi:hypothetical protein